jgi:hypothetical protein
VLQEKKKNKSGVSIFYSVHHRHHHFGSIIKKKRFRHITGIHFTTWKK